MLRLFLVVLLSLVAVVLTSCDSGTLNPLPEGYDPDGRCIAGKTQILPEDEWDSLQVRCDTVFIRDTVIVYGDTVYEDTVVTKHNYIGFKYFDRFLNDYDTLVGIRVDERSELADSYHCGHRPVYCDLDSTQKTFSCQTGTFCYSVMYSTELSQSRVVAYPNPPIVHVPKGHAMGSMLCNRSGYKCVHDRVYRDTMYLPPLYKDVYDTTFLNYGRDAWTDYVPAVNAPLFDTYAFRMALDTLDTQKPIFGMDSLFTGYFITVEGLPEWAEKGHRSHCTKQGDKTVCTTAVEAVGSLLGSYPTVYEKVPFFLENRLESPLEKDTVITWVLRYNYLGGWYLGGWFEGDSDSLTITTLFKGSQK